MALANPNQQPNQNPRQLGTGFTNLQNIMQANTGNKLGQAVSSGIQQTGKQASDSLNSGVQDFNTQSQNNALGTQAQKEDVQNTLNNVSNVNPSQVANFAKYRSGTYGGPTDINNISNISNQANNAEKQGQQVASSGGREALLQQYASNPSTSYNSGQRNLDNLLLGTTGGKDLQTARQSVSGLNNKVNTAETTAQNSAKQLQNQAQGFGKQVTGQVQGAQSSIYNPAQQKAQEANIAEANNQTAEQAAVQAAQNGQLSANALQQLGLTAGQRNYGVNVGQYLGYTPQNEQATAYNTMTQPQFQNYTNLQKLMGQTPTQAPQATYQAGKTTYDQGGAQSAIAAAKAPVDAAQTALQNAQTAYNAAQNGSGDPFARMFAIMSAQRNLNEAQNNYTNLNNQLGGTLSST